MMSRLELGWFAALCLGLNVCDDGLFYASPDLVPGCFGAAGCCTAFCVAGDDSPCLDGQSCMPFFPEGAPAECLEDVGACMQ